MEPTTLPVQLLALLKKHELTLDDSQPHIGGERALLSPGKLVLMAKTTTNQPVVVKYSITPAGAKEISQEAKIRRLFEELPFSEQRFLLPRILLHETSHSNNFLVSEFISQTQVLQDYSLEQQFFMSIQSLENQETFHTTTNEHSTYIRDHFEALTTKTYLQSLNDMIAAIIQQRPTLAPLLTAVQNSFYEHKSIINTFGSYLVHTDFVPHNFRITNNQFYLLDYVSFRIANKYESWARYINFMELHQPVLARLLVSYLQEDRNEHEFTAFWLLRLYRLVFLLNYYCSIFEKTDDDLHVLTEARIVFFCYLLKNIYNKTSIPEELVTNYTKTRDGLRTETEKERQRTFTKAN